MQCFTQKFSTLISVTSLQSAIGLSQNPCETAETYWVVDLLCVRKDLEVLHFHSHFTGPIQCICEEDDGGWGWKD